MRIAFICAGMEPGRDGVGDYVRRIAGELIRQGNYVIVVAANDRFLAEELEASQDADGTPLSVLRLPEAWTRQKVIDRVKNCMGRFRPEWISLQFVIYGFSRKGLGIGLVRFFSELKSFGRCHIMFHELWVGLEREASFRHILIGVMQRNIILGIIKRLRPQAIHTQTQLYANELSQYGCKAELLPLFSNISCMASNNQAAELANDILPPVGIRFVHFGSIHPEAPIESFSLEAKCLSHKKKVAVSLILIGRSGKEAKRWRTAWMKAGLHSLDLGEQPPKVIVEILKRCNIGLSSNPIDLIQKSGSAAALRDCGLPIICLSRNWTPRRPGRHIVDMNIRRYRRGNLAALSDASFTRSEDVFSLQSIAARMHHELKQVSQLAKD